jgi:hypothetical protein
MESLKLNLKLSVVASAVLSFIISLSIGSISQVAHAAPRPEATATDPTLHGPLNWAGTCQFTGSDGDAGSIDIENFSVQMTQDQISFGLYDIIFTDGVSEYTLEGMGRLNGTDILAKSGETLGNYTGTSIQVTGTSLDQRFTSTLSAQLKSPNTPGERESVDMKLHVDMGAAAGWVDAVCENLTPQP